MGIARGISRQGMEFGMTFERNFSRGLGLLERRDARVHMSRFEVATVRIIMVHRG